MCFKTFSVESMGESALASHAKGKFHQEKIKQKSLCLEMDNFLKDPQNKQSSSTACAETAAATEITARKTLSGFVSQTDTLNAEIIWALKVASSGVGDVFRRMFRNSDIAENLSCGENKCMYLCSFGLAPHFLSLLYDKVKDQDGYVLLFDESMNGITPTKQMDFHVQ